MCSFYVFQEYIRNESYKHQRPRNWRQVRQAEPIFLTKQPQGNQLGTDQATQIQDVDNKGR